MATTIKQKLVRRVYWPNCSVCQYMKKNRDFRYRIMQSTYFNPNGTESAGEVVHAFGDPFVLSTFYAHMQRHQHKDLIKAQVVYDKSELAKTETVSPAVVIGAVEGEIVSSRPHEQGLDEFIKEGREKLIRKELQITSTSYLQAIKIKMDNEAKTKDRRLDAVKTMFKGITDDTRTSQEG